MRRSDFGLIPDTKCEVNDFEYRNIYGCIKELQNHYGNFGSVNSEFMKRYLTNDTDAPGTIEKCYQMLNNPMKPWRDYFQYLSGRSQSTILSAIAGHVLAMEKGEVYDIGELSITDYFELK